MGVGLQFLWSYENKAARSKKATLRIPASHSITLDARRPTVVVFAHPHCPCSRASLVQLERIFGTFENKLSARIYFYKPKGQTDEWLKTELWRMALRFPNTAITPDHEGYEAKRFGATTSGEVFVYSPDGAMLFHGGLTASRGHEGDSVGTRSLEQIVHQGYSEVVEAAVFGCSLFQNTKDTFGGS